MIQKEPAEAPSGMERGTLPVFWLMYLPQVGVLGAMPGRGLGGGLEGGSRKRWPSGQMRRELCWRWDQADGIGLVGDSEIWLTCTALCAWAGVVQALLRTRIWERDAGQEGALVGCWIGRVSLRSLSLFC